MRVTERSLHVDDDESPPRIHTARGSVTQHPRAIDVEAEFDQFVAELIPMAARWEWAQTVGGATQDTRTAAVNLRGDNLRARLKVLDQ